MGRAAQDVGDVGREERHLDRAEPALPAEDVGDGMAVHQDLVPAAVGDGPAAPELDVATATDLLWTLASVRVCEDLVVTRRWASGRYRTHMRRTIRCALLGPG